MQLDGGTIAPPPQGRFSGGAAQPFWFEVLAPIPLWRQLSGTSGGQTTEEDALVESFTGATEARDWRWPVYPLPRTESQVITLASSAPGVATLDGDTARYVSTGSSTLTYSCAARSIEVTLAFATRGGVTTKQLVNYVEGSAARAACDGIDGRIDGLLPASAMPIYSTADHAAGAYVRNTGCWCADVEGLTAISPWNSFGGTARAGVLVTPRHALTSTHYPVQVGTIMRWVTMDNEVVSREVVSVVPLAGYRGSPVPWPDLSVAVLDADVPAGVVPVKVLPADYAVRMPSVGVYGQIATLCVDAQERALVQDWRGPRTYWTAGGLVGVTEFAAPTDAARLAFFEPKVAGDSSSPVFLVLDGELVLLACLSYQALHGVVESGGTDMPPHYAELDAILGAAGDYQLSQADLSAYPDYTAEPPAHLASSTTLLASSTEVLASAA